MHLIYTIDVGGAEKQLLALAKLQSKERHVTVAYFSGTSTLSDEFTNAGINVLRMPQKLRDSIRLLNAIARSGSLIHSHLPHAELFVALFLDRREKFITTRHVAGRYSRRIPELFGLILLNYVILRASQVIAISEVVKNDIKKRALLNNRLIDKIHVIHYGFDFSTWCIDKSINKSKPKNYSRTVVLGTVARLEKQKNLAFLIRSLSKVYLPFELKVVGDGSQKFRLSSMIKRLGLEKNVFLLGKTNEVADFLDGIDIFVLPSKYEGFGIVLAEAALRRKLILASDIAICREVLGDDGAIFFNPRNMKSLIHAIQVASNIYEENSYINSSIVNVQKFNLRNLIQKTNLVYEKLSE